MLNCISCGILRYFKELFQIYKANKINSKNNRLTLMIYRFYLEDFKNSPILNISIKIPNNEKIG